MEISAINSPLLGFEDSLTSPFLDKKVTINAHTPEEEIEPPEEDETFSRNFFNQRKFARLRSAYSNISAHEFKSQKEIIENSIDGGISPLDAIKIYKAAQSYGLNSIGSTSGVQRLSIYANEV